MGPTEHIMAELATLEAVRTASGTEADAAAAWAAVEASNVGVDLGALPGDTPPAESAAAETIHKLETMLADEQMQRKAAAEDSAAEESPWPTSALSRAA